MAPSRSRRPASATKPRPGRPGASSGTSPRSSSAWAWSLFRDTRRARAGRAPGWKNSFSPASPPTPGLRPRWSRPYPGSRVSKGYDRSAADAANRKLGDAGEEFVVAMERRRLTSEGRADLADKVAWTARDVGDGAGYDVASFNADGTVRLIEVKTTYGDAATAFFVTANEVRVSAARPGDYWLYRVYDFDKPTRAIYRLQGALDGGALALEPVAYRATSCRKPPRP